MITINYETDFVLANEQEIIFWIEKVIHSEGKKVGAISYIFCDDAYLHTINTTYLHHDTYTDIISFDYTENDTISGDIFISLDRVKENAEQFKVTFFNELKRVIIHGILHYCGYKDKTKQDVVVMRNKEDEKIKMFHVEHKK